MIWYVALAVTLLVIVVSILWVNSKKVSRKNKPNAKKTYTESAKGIIATSFGITERKKFEKEASETLRKANIDGNTEYEVEFGIFGRVGKHRAVLIHVHNEEKLSFRLDLCVESNQREKSSPCPKCNILLEDYEDYFNHIEKEHSNECFSETCCDENFSHVLNYREHVYKCHYNVENVTSVSLKFNRIGNEKCSYDEFMEREKDHISLYSDHKKKVKFIDLLGAALSIAQHFGNYYMFFWNCQDFAAWFLTFNGIPLKEIDPTATDQITGSNSSHGSVQKTKGWLYYKDLDDKEKQKFRIYFPGIVYTCGLCPWLPPMKVEQLMRHHQLAHPQ